MSDTIIGGDGAEYIDASARPAAVHVAAGGGADRVIGSTSHDTLLGEGGNDQLVGNAGDDSLDGGTGNDSLNGGDGQDTLLGSEGNDSLSGHADGDSLTGGAGSDTLSGGDGSDTLDGGEEIDSLSGDNGDDLLYGRPGDDRMNGGAGKDTLFGGDGADSLTGSTEDDALAGEAGSDTLLGGDGSDTLDGGADADTLMGAAGDDSIDGGAGNDRIEGQEGRDTVLGGAGDDVVKQTTAAAPASGLDLLDGGEGYDTLEVYLTAAQWADAGIQADLAGLSDHFGGPTSQTQSHVATALKLSAVRFEGLSVVVDGVSAPTGITLAGGSVAENADGAVIGTLATVGPAAGTGITYAVDDARFEVADGVLRLKAGSMLDHEAGDTVSLNVTSTTDTGLGITRTFSVTVTDLNEAPTDIALSNAEAAENTAGAVIGTLSSTDQDAGSSFTYSLVGDPDGLFEIAGNTLRLAAGKAHDFEAVSSHDVTVRTTDQGGLSFDRTFTIAVTNLDEAPVIESGDRASIGENVGTRVAVYTAAGSDPDGDAITWSLAGGADAALFDIDASTGAVTFKASPNFEAPADSGANNIYDIVLRATANGQATDQAVAIGVTNLNEAPVVASAIPDVYTTFGAIQHFSIASRFADPDAGTKLTYSITGGDLPWGVCFNAKTGVFSGIALSLGAVDVTVRASDGTSFVEDTFRFSVSSPTLAVCDERWASSFDDFLDFRGRSTGVKVEARAGEDTIYGSAFNDTLDGGTGIGCGDEDDRIQGGGGNDVLTSGNANDADIFLYAEANSGRDTITDFKDRFDKIGFVASATGVDSFADLQVTKSAGGNVLVSWDTGIGQGSILLQGITKVSLITAADFVFA